MARGSKKRATVLLILAAPLLVAGIVAVVWWFTAKDIAIFDAAGVIAREERGLLIFASLLSLLVVIPVFILTYHVAWKYRADNKKARYEPDWDNNNKLEALWWGVPLALITILSVVTWISSYRLDPFRPIESTKKPLEIQVVALQWKWLFIYPEQNIASVNYVQFPEDRPVTFTITSDAPMNSFWIPELGGQIYAMSGMSTKLHLMADNPGEYRGVSANLSGEGFADMAFAARSSTEPAFDAWVQDIKNYNESELGHISTILNQDVYETLRQPGVIKDDYFYAAIQPGLYDEIVHHYMDHPAGTKQPNHQSVEH